MKISKLFVFLFAAAIVPVSAAFAATIEADIVRLDRNNSVLILSPLDAQNKGREVEVTLKEVHSYWGVDSLSDLEKGRVVINVEDTTPDIWAVQTLERMTPRVEGGATTYSRTVDTTVIPAKSYEVVIERDMPHDASNPKYENLGRRGTETYVVTQPEQRIVRETLAQNPQARTTTTTNTTARVS